MRKGLVVGLILLLVMVTAACGGSSTPSDSGANTGSNSNNSNESSNESASPDTTQEAKVVNIGYSGPLSGPAAFYGKRTLSGIEMAVEEINSSGGFEVNGQTYTLNLVSLDDKYLPNETGANAKRLIQEHQTPVIFTPHSGGVFAMQVFNEQDHFLIMAYTSEPKITEGGNSLTVRIPPRYDGYIATFTNYSMERFGKKLAALPTATQYGKDWTETLLPYWKEQGGEVVYESAIDFTKDTDFFTIITNALNEDPDVLFIGGPSEPTAKVAQQARELGFKGGFIIMDQAKLDEMKAVSGTYETFEGAIGVMPLIHSEYPGTPQFVENYEGKYGETPGSEAGLNYIATYILVEAMKAAGSVDDPKAIRAHMQDGLDNLPEDKQVYVIPSIGEDGGFEADLSVAAVEDGEIVPIKVE